MTTAPALSPDGEDAPPVDIARGLLRSALHAVLGGVAGLALGIVAYFVATPLFHLNNSTSTLVLMLGGGLVLGVAFSGSLVRMIGLAPRGRSRSLVVGGDEGRSEIQLLAGWLVGLVLVLACGWGLIALCYYAASSLHYGGEKVAAALAALLSLGLFSLLEYRHWLSRLMGLHVAPGSPAWKSAVFLWLFGVPGLLVRSTLAARAAQAPDPAKPAGQGRRRVARRRRHPRSRRNRRLRGRAGAACSSRSTRRPSSSPPARWPRRCSAIRKMVVCPECGYRVPRQLQPAGRSAEQPAAGLGQGRHLPQLP